MLKILFAGNLDELRQDLRRRFAKHADKSLWWKMSYYHGRRQYRTLFYYRLWSASRSRVFRSLFRFLYERNSSRTGIEFHTPRLGGGVIMPHWGRIILK